MNLELAIILMLLMIGTVALIKKDDDYKKSEIENNNILPYRKRYLLTKTEYVFYRTLKDMCSNTDIHICPKIRLEDLAEVTTKQNHMKYRGYIKSRHVDFTLCDSNLNIIAAIELDDYSHNTKKAKQTDAFKNQLFATIGIPLFRILVCNNYEGQIQNMFTQLNIDTKRITEDTASNASINDMLEKQNNIIMTQNKMLQEIIEHNKKAN